MLAVLKLLIEGDAAYVRDLNSFVTLEQYTDACAKIQDWDAYCSSVTNELRSRT